MWNLYVTPIIRKKIETARTQSKGTHPIQRNPKDNVIQDEGASGVKDQEQKPQFNTPPNQSEEAGLLD